MRTLLLPFQQNSYIQAQYFTLMNRQRKCNIECAKTLKFHILPQYDVYIAYGSSIFFLDILGPVDRNSCSWFGHPFMAVIFIGSN